MDTCAALRLPEAPGSRQWGSGPRCRNPAARREEAIRLKLAIRDWHKLMDKWPPMVEWTQEKIATLSGQEISSLRANATKSGRQDIVGLCNAELERRKPVRVRRAMEGGNEDRRGQYVRAFHFVCPSELGVTRSQDGGIWTGTWVVAVEHAERALKYGAVVALHTSKAEPSYLQGPIKDWRKSPRELRYTGEQTTQKEEGIDFFFQFSDSPMQWIGEATGEKGYDWAPLPK